jgi:Tfp pilus assembly protein PilO
MNELKERIALMEFPKILMIALFIGGAYYWQFFNDGSQLESRLGDLDKKVESEKKKKTETQKTLAEQDRMGQSIEVLNKQFVEISKRIPAELTSVDINKMIDGFVRMSGVNMLTRSPLLPVKGEIVEEVPIEIKARGKTEQIAQFIYLLTTGEKILRIKNINMTLDDNLDPNAPNVRLEGTIVGFRLLGDLK